MQKKIGFFLGPFETLSSQEKSVWSYSLDYRGGSNCCNGILPIILFPLSGGMGPSFTTAAFRSGYLKIPDMVSKGIILNISSILLIAVMVYLIL